LVSPQSSAGAGAGRDALADVGRLLEQALLVPGPADAREAARTMVIDQFSGQLGSIREERSSH
jgi:hypothetical protein